MAELPSVPGVPGRFARERVPAMARAYGAASAGWLRAGALLHALHEGVWLGLLRRADLHAIDQRFYERNAAYYGDEHNLRGLFPWEETALEAFAGCRRVLVMAAGGGREVLALSRLGFEVEGYECNPVLVEYAQELLPRQGCAARVRHLPRDGVPAADLPFDGIVIGWSAYALIPGRHHRIELLRRLRGQIVAAGPILISFFSRVRDSPRIRIATAVANTLRSVLGRRRRVERGDTLTTNFVHYFTEQEIAAELREAGWEPRCYTPHGTGGRDSGWAIGVARDPETECPVA